MRFVKEWVGVFLAVALTLTVLAKRDDPFIFLNEDEVLQVDFNYTADIGLRVSTPALADQMEDRAREDFSEALEAVLERSDLPVAVELLDPHSKPEKGLPVLSVHAVRWASDGMGSMELVIRVKLTSDNYRNRIGSYRVHDSSFGLTTYEQVSRVKVKLMKEALGKMVFDLDQHFKLPDEE